MTAKQLLDAGKVHDAEGALAAHLREHPTDLESRTFLFELLCFSGQYDRAEKQLGVLSQGGKEAEMGAVLYYSALHAEKTRHEIFRKEEFPSVPAAVAAGQAEREALPVYPGRRPGHRGASGGVCRRRVSLDSFPAHRLLADAATAAPARHALVAGIRSDRAVLSRHGYRRSSDSRRVSLFVEIEDEPVWLGRTTEWVADDEGHEYPVGQKMFLVDDEEVPLLEIRSLEFASDASS
jgi:type VI secretion system protein ImpE